MRPRTTLLATLLVALPPAFAQTAPTLDPALLFAHPGLVDGDLDAVTEDILAAFERDLDSPYALDAVRRVIGLELDEVGTAMDRGRLDRIQALAEAAKDAEVELLLENLWLRTAERWRFSANPIERPSDLRDEFVTNWRVVGPLGPVDVEVPQLAPPVGGTPEVHGLGSGDTLRYGAEFERTGRMAGEGPVSVGWSVERRAPNAVQTNLGRGLWPRAGFVYGLAFVRFPGVEDGAERILELRTDGVYRAYWNGALAIDVPRIDPTDVGARRLLRVRVGSGWNALLVRLPMAGDTGIGARFLGLDGTIARFEELGRDEALPAVTVGVGAERVPESGSTAVSEEEGGPFAPALSVTRLTFAGRPDLALTVDPPTDPAGMGAWRLASLFALDSARHLDPEAWRRRVLAHLEALEDEGPHYADARQRRINWLLREDRPLEALAAADLWVEAAPERAWPRVARARVLGVIDPTGALAKLYLEDVVRAFPMTIGANGMLAAYLAQEGDSRRALDLSWELVERFGAADTVGAFLDRIGERGDPRVGVLLERVRGLRAAQPDDAELLGLEVRLLDRSGLGDQLLALRREEAERRAGIPDPWWNLGTALFDAGLTEEGRAALQRELSFRPADETSRRIVGALGVEDPAERFFDEFAPDLEAALERARGVTDASVVEALDSGLIYVFPDGSSHSRNASVSFAADRAGIEALSALPIREGTRVMRVEKADGTELEPTNAGGEWVLPSLEVGDVIEMEWDQRLDAPAPGAPTPHHIWRFASFERAFPTSRWVIYVPDGLPRGRVETLQFDGDHQEIPWKGGTVHVLETSMERQQPEPAMPPYERLLPLAAFGSDADRADDLRSYRAWTTSNMFVPADLAAGIDAFIQENADGLVGPAAAKALYDALDERAQDFQGDVDAASVWQTSRGWPLFLLAAMLDRSGVRFEWGVLETGVSPELQPYPSTIFENDYSLGQVILRVETDGDPVWVLPGNAPGTPFGELPSAAAGARVFVLQGDGARDEWLPRDYLEDRYDAEITLVYEVAADGTATVRGRFSNSGPDGVMALGQVRQATGEQRRGFALGQAGSLAPGADIEDARVVLDGSEGPGLVVTFEGTRPRFATEQAGGAWVATLPFLALNLTQRFGPAERQWPLEIRSPSRFRASVTVRLDPAFEVERGPEPIVEAREGFSVGLSVESLGEREIRFVQGLDQRALVVQPDGMQAFLARMADVEAEFERALRLVQKQ